MGIYRFDEQDAYRFAQRVGARTKVRGSELVFKSCPYCHGGKNHKPDTFSISLETGAYNCLRSSCGVKGNMITLSKDFDFSLGTETDDYYNKSAQNRYKPLPQPKEKIIPKPEAIQYLTGRGIAEEIIAKYEVTVRNDHPDVVVFPFYDEKGTLRYIKYRNTKPVKKGAKEYQEAGTMPILFGMKQADAANRRMIVTEGEIDALSVATAGYTNTFSIPNGVNNYRWVPWCWDWMHTNFDEIVIFGDHEHGHITMVDDFNRRFGDAIIIKVVREEDYKDCKDANDILRKYGTDQIKTCVNNAEPLPVSGVVDYSTIGRVDPFGMEKLSTTMRRLDNTLYGGLPFGFVHIIAGDRGDGKSTFASQILSNAVDCGYNSFAYSGELTTGLFKAWMNYQIVGMDNIITNTNIAGIESWMISNQAWDSVDRWAQGRLFVYDNSAINGDEKTDLLNIVEKEIQRDNVKVILIDNLMVALDLTAKQGTDKYDIQSQFVKKLATIATRYDVLILLVAHRRKNSFDDDENNAISGSADITNIAGTVLTYARFTKKDRETLAVADSDRKILLSKNRLFGKLDLTGTIAHFQEKSKRIFGDDDSPNRHYHLDIYTDAQRKPKEEPKPKDDEKFMNVEQEELPFDVEE